MDHSLNPIHISFQELLLSKSALAPSSTRKRKLSKVERQHERRQKRERDREKREYERKRRRERHGKHRKDGLVTEHFIPVSLSVPEFTFRILSRNLHVSLSRNIDYNTRKARAGK